MPTMPPRYDGAWSCGHRAFISCLQREYKDQSPWMRCPVCAAKKNNNNGKDEADELPRTPQRSPPRYSSDEEEAQKDSESD